jgi:hypothetical protein
MAHAPIPDTVSTDRRQALAELDAAIEQAECTRTRYLVHVEELTAAGRDAAAERAMLRQAEDRLVRLRESRTVLVTGELARSGDEGE